MNILGHDRTLAPFIYLQTHKKIFNFFQIKKIDVEISYKKDVNHGAIL
jgi:hypothetical protein